MGKYLLMVDDDKNTLDALVLLFEDKKYNLILVTGGEQGLSLLEQYPIGVIISDQRMPGMTGVEFLIEAKKKYPDTIRIIMSGYAEFKTVTSAINEGSVYKFITKPWVSDQLLSCVDEAFHYYDLNQENKKLLKLLADQEQLVFGLQREIQYLKR